MEAHTYQFLEKAWKPDGSNERQLLGLTSDPHHRYSGLQGHLKIINIYKSNIQLSLRFQKNHRIISNFHQIKGPKTLFSNQKLKCHTELQKFTKLHSGWPQNHGIVSSTCNSIWNCMNETSENIPGSWQLMPGLRICCYHHHVPCWEVQASMFLNTYQFWVLNKFVCWSYSLQFH